MKHFIPNKKTLVALSLLTPLLISGCNEQSAATSSIQSQTEQDAAEQSRISTATSSLDAQLNVNVKRKNAADLAHYLQRSPQDDVFYFVMPDRFNNGNRANDQGSKTQPISAGGFDPSGKGMFHGGDIKGLQEKLPYLKELGISAIWLTPILRNQAMQDDSAGYHGYWVLDFTEIDPHLGSNADLKALIDSAHQQNIKIYFDIITNHTADVIKYQECHGADGLQWLVKTDGGCPFKSTAQVASGDNYQTVIPTGQTELKTPAWLNEVKYYHNQGDSTWQGESSIRGDFAGLDDINTDDPAVVTGMIEIFKNLITEFKPDGFRIDTVKHVNTEFWSEFSPALVSHAQSLGIPNFFMFGEVYSSDSKVLSEYTTKGKMQSVLDFGFQKAVADALIHQQGSQSFAALFTRDIDYLDQDSNANQLLNFTGNHDMGRFAYMLRQSEFNYSETQIEQRLTLAHAMMYFMRGMPIIYYGDEQGFVGDGGDQDARQDMMPSLVASYNDDDLLATTKTTADDNFDQQHPFYQSFAEFADIYYQYSALRHGEQNIVFQANDNEIFAISRTLANNEQSLVVAFNTSDSDAKASLGVDAKHYKLIYGNASTPTNDTGELTIALAPLSFAIYRRLNTAKN